MENDTVAIDFIFINGGEPNHMVFKGVNRPDTRAKMELCNHEQGKKWEHFWMAMFSRWKLSPAART